MDQKGRVNNVNSYQKENEGYFPVLCIRASFSLVLSFVFVTFINSLGHLVLVVYNREN